jgi:hypothetical protein
MDILQNLLKNGGYYRDFEITSVLNINVFLVIVFLSEKRGYLLLEKAINV